MVEHLADRLADLMQRAATAGASLILHVQPDVLAWQVGRQARPLPLRFVGFGLDRRESGFEPCQIDLKIFEAKAQLVVIKPFGAPAELVALQLLDDEVETLDLGLRLAK